MKQPSSSTTPLSHSESSENSSTSSSSSTTALANDNHLIKKAQILIEGDACFVTNQKTYQDEIELLSLSTIGDVALFTKPSSPTSSTTIEIYHSDGIDEIVLPSNRPPPPLSPFFISSSLLATSGSSSDERWPSQKKSTLTERLSISGGRHVGQEMAIVPPLDQIKTITTGKREGGYCMSEVSSVSDEKGSCVDEELRERNEGRLRDDQKSEMETKPKRRKSFLRKAWKIVCFRKGS
eukprot:CAMPEP_0202453168 /NCGR_PEP_ID=MMETSP1360-20130828/11197_1 /ASSEMBLY_ACC=CAM_ASM_000848 /TAXON_ID=515479 /ORGANISM="Licmophora paradoxa, Strain CCMP2313" /LENGTH=236 /DNA_ID=CAMNT_0049072183 /DNA_START=345 /DNA_END=1055 /DNA_ORIENTATION=-